MIEPIEIVRTLYFFVPAYVANITPVLVRGRFEGLAKPMLIGRPEVIAARIEKFGLRLAAGKDFELVNINSDARYKAAWQLYYQRMGRNGVSPEDAKEAVLRKTPRAELPPPSPVKTTPSAFNKRASLAA